MAKLKGQNTIKDDLGAFRSLASQAAHDLPEIDEEEFFLAVAESYLKGIRTEVSRIFGPSRARRLLDPFSRENG